MEKVETIGVDLELKIIAKLLDMPTGEQIYRREIGILFDILELKAKPMFITEN